MATLYPNGYGGTPAGTSDMRTIEGVEQRTTVQRLHPEFWRRVRAMMQFAATQGVMLGVGTGWRVQPRNPDGSCKPGFACPGNSYHEGWMPDGVSRPDGVHDVNAMAADMVLESSMAWMGANCGAFGLVDFSDVNGEPWHIQPVEIPRSRNFATAMPSLQTWRLPGSPPSGGSYVSGTIVKSTTGVFWYSTGTLKKRMEVQREIDLMRLMIARHGGNSADYTGVSDAEVAAYFGVDIDVLNTKVVAIEAAANAIKTAAGQALAAANDAKTAAEAAAAAADGNSAATLAAKDAADAAAVAAEAARVAAVEAEKAAKAIPGGGGSPVQYTFEGTAVPVTPA